MGKTSKLLPVPFYYNFILILIRPLKAIAIQVTGDLSKGERSYHNNNYYCSGYSVSVVYNNIAV